jgi:DNA-binding CsgD family transcriptional regulator
MGPAPALAEKVQHLTPREKEVLSVIAQGHSLSETAQRLGVTRNTIASQVKNIYTKLNISSRAEAALAASQMGIIG